MRATCLVRDGRAGISALAYFGVASCVVSPRLGDHPFDSTGCSPASEVENGRGDNIDRCGARGDKRALSGTSTTAGAAALDSASLAVLDLERSQLGKPGLSAAAAQGDLATTGPGSAGLGMVTSGGLAVRTGGSGMHAVGF